MNLFRIPMLLLTVVLGSLPTLAAQQQRLAGHVPSQIQKSAPIGRLNPTNQLRIAISLPLRNTNALQQYLRDVYNPASPIFHHYLTPEVFTAQYGPTVEDYEGVQAFCRTNGLIVLGTHPNRTVLDVAGSVNAIERAFHTTLQEYRHPTENRTFFAPLTNPSVDLAIPILHIHGLDNFNRPHPLSKRILLDTTANVLPDRGSGSRGAYLGKDFRAAYAPGVTLTGGGQTVALLELDGYYANDITSYVNQAGLSAIPLENILVDQFNGKPGPGNGEVSLDIQMAISMAPGLDKILVYETSTNSLAIDLLNRIATDNRANQISSSWTWGTYDPGTDQTFQQYAAQGQSFFQASGDSGAYPGPVDAPADNPYITVVGGTSLTTSSSGKWTGETTWNDGLGDAPGGGISTIYPLPSWQSGLNMSANFGSTSGRNLPDVAMVADNVINIADNGSTYQTIGTSIAAPLWAAFIALVNQQATAQGLPAIGFINPALYTLAGSTNYPSAFHDITTGDNSTSSQNGFPATANYDLCTGWGAPTGSNTINLLIQVAYNQLDHFAWSSITSPIPAGSPVAVALTAHSAASNSVTGFTGPVTLSAIQTRTNLLFGKDFENDSLSEWTNEGGSYTLNIDATTGAASTPNSLTLIGGSKGAYDGASHALANITPTLVEFYVKSADNTLTSGYFVAGQSKYITNSAFHFRMDGTGAMGLTDGPGNFYSTPYSANQWYKIDLRLNWSLHTVDYYVDDSLVMPNIPFCNPSVSSLATLNLYNFDNAQAWWDQIRFTTTTSTVMNVSPPVAATFNNGVWNGSVAITSGGTNLTLLATDQAGHIGISSPFDVQAGAFTTITVAASPDNGGSVTGGGTFASGSQQTLSATPNTGWGFSTWMDNNTQNPRTITVPSTNVTYTAVFLQLPQITIQPLSLTTGPGTSATFSITASGPGPLTYLWYRNGSPNNNATNSSYTLAPVLAAYSGEWFNCQVSNAGGAVQSDRATLTVLPIFSASALRSADHTFTAILNGTSGSNYVVLVSTNLKTWSPITTLRLNGSSMSFTDTNTIAPWKFYQIQAAP